VTIRRVIDCMIGFTDILHTPLWTTGNYSATANLHTLQFTVTHTLVSSPSPEDGNRYSFRNIGFFGIQDDGKIPEKFCEFCTTASLLTANSKYRGTIAHTKSSLHSQTFNSTELHSIILMPQFLNSISLLPSLYRGRHASRNSTDSNELLFPFYNPSARTMQKTQPLYCWGGVFTESLHINDRGTDHIENTALQLWRALISAGTCLQSRCLVINVYSGSAIPAFMGHVTVY
jgi:hypothetical protein